jgi:hypothetical protein
MFTGFAFLASLVALPERHLIVEDIFNVVKTLFNCDYLFIK